MSEIVVAVTGASGSVYARRLLECLAASDTRVHLLVSDAGALVIGQELGVRIDPLKPDPAALLGETPHRITGYSFKNFAAPIASGTRAADGMIVIPCTAGTLGSIASGVCRNLIDRAADVTLKERRRLVLVLRETPLSAIQIENMLKITRAGGIVLPASPGFYSGQETFDDLVDFVVGKALDALGIESDVLKRWRESS